jgi:hypothetical protein
VYGDKDAIRLLASNIRSGLTDDEIEAAAAVEDAELDMRLGEIYYWPLKSDGSAYDTVPPAIIQIANLMTAAFFEEVRFAQNEAIGSGENPYGSSLRKRANRLLEQVLRGWARVPGLEHCARIRARAAQQVHHPVPPRGPRSGRF